MPTKKEAQAAFKKNKAGSLSGRLARSLDEVWTDVRDPQAAMQRQIFAGMQPGFEDQLAVQSPMRRAETPGIQDIMPINQPQAAQNLKSVQKQAASVPPAAPKAPGQVDPKTALSDRDKLMKELEKAYQSNIGLRQERIQGQQQLAQGLAQSYEPQLDLAPLIAWADSETGSNMMKGFQRAESPQERMKMIEALKGGITKQQGGISQDQLSLIKSKLQDAQFEDVLQARKETALLKAQMKGMGHKMTTGSITKITANDDAIGQLGELKNLVIKNKALLGPVEGLAKFNPFNVESRKILADLDRIRQGVGKTLEGGVLRKEDEIKYKKILATITDKPEVAEYKINQLLNMVQEGKRNYLNNLERAKYDVSGFQILDEKQPGAPDTGAGPKVGDVVDGYKYLGGDPGLESSWGVQ